MAEPLLDGLNEPQRLAVVTTEGPLLILAGAGSGKTRVLTHRIAWLVQQGVAPWRILALTFTNKAAQEMRHRVEQIVGDPAKRMMVTTFHSACVRFLREDIQHLGYPRSFVVYDTDDQLRLVKEIMRVDNIQGKDWTPAKLRGAIDRAKNKMTTPDQLAEELRSSPGNPTVRVYRRYDAALKAAGAVDFNDLLNLMVKLFQEHPAVLRRYQERFRYIMVDEYQDTNKAQYTLLQLLMKRPAGESRNLAVVGDDDQSIYAFRGADIQNILDFERDFPEVTVVRLEQNYRSTEPILEVAHAVVRHNRGRMEKKLWTAQKQGEAVRLITSMDEAEEAETIAGEIRRGSKSGDGTGTRYGDVAIIYRTNAASRPFEQVMVRAGIPHILVGAARFYERKEVRDLLAYLKLILNPADNMALLRIINVPGRGIGPKAVDGIRDAAEAEGLPMLAGLRRWSQDKGKAKEEGRKLCVLLDQWRESLGTLPAGELVHRVVEQSGYGPMLRAENTDESKGRLENLEALARAVEERFDDAMLYDDLFREESSVDLEDPEARLRFFVDRVSLAGQDESLPGPEDEGKVTLLTAHLAKGLEFSTVYVVGMHEGGFPHFRAMEDERELEEERRLAYVAFTRAKSRLVLCRARRRLVPGSGFKDVPPSPFLRLIPPHLLKQGSTWSSAGSGPSPFEQRLAARQRPASTWTAPASLSARPGPAATANEESVRTVALDDATAVRAGMEVLHPTFGRGTVQEVQGSPGNQKLVVHFRHHGRKSLMARMANLELVLP